MYNFNQMRGGLGTPQTRQFSTGRESKPFFKAMPSTTGFLNKINMESIASHKKFVNPNYVNKHNTSIHSVPTNLKLNPCQQLTELCSEFAMAPNNFSMPTVKSFTPFNTEQTEKKENTQRKKEYRRTPYPKSRHDHSHSPQKSHKNKINIDLKYEIDEVGIDVLSDAFESDSNSNTPTVDIETPPVFIHEAIPEFKTKSDYKISSPICITIETPETMPTVLFSINTETRARLPSECGSEDSFIVFQCSTEDDDDDEDTTDIESDVDSYEETENSDSEYTDDEHPLERFDGIDAKAKRTSSKKVTFSNDLCKVYPMVKWSYAYQSARKGPWEEYARDRCRFKDRIAKIEGIINPILKPDHRQKVYKQRYL